MELGTEPSLIGFAEYFRPDKPIDELADLFISLSSACTGEEALGLASGLVTDQQISASSLRDKDYGPENARLNFTGVRLDMMRSIWKTDYSDQNAFVQVDFWRNVKITKFQTQGYHHDDTRKYDWWVKNYTLSYSVDGSPLFQTYQENSADKVKKKERFT